jgi:phosphatidylinositol kinase/protein kinase (PI-3  family)
MSLQELDEEIARGEALLRLRERLPEVMNDQQLAYLSALHRDRIQLIARGRL